MFIQRSYTTIAVFVHCTISLAFLYFSSYFPMHWHVKVVYQNSWGGAANAIAVSSVVIVSCGACHQQMWFLLSFTPGVIIKTYFFPFNFLTDPTRRRKISNLCTNCRRQIVSPLVHRYRCVCALLRNIYDFLSTFFFGLFLILFSTFFFFYSISFMSFGGKTVQKDHFPEVYVWLNLIGSH